VNADQRVGAAPEWGEAGGGQSEARRATDRWIARWLDAMVQQSSWTLEARVTATGDYERAIDRVHAAHLIVVAEPATDLTIESALPVGLRAKMDRAGYFEAAVFGLLDGLLANPRGPLRRVRVRITSATIHATDASVFAFRQAGRDAAEKLIVASRPAERAAAEQSAHRARVRG
jgi:hypothetical protein